MQNCVTLYVLMSTACATWLIILILVIIMTKDQFRPLKIELE